MKSLKSYINESRGVVNNENDWTSICKELSKIKISDLDIWEDKSYHNPIKFYKKVYKENLPIWLNQLTFLMPLESDMETLMLTSLTGAIACVPTDELEVKDNKLVNINVFYSPVYFKKEGVKTYVIDHELQHAFDKLKSGGKIINNKYHIRVEADPFAEDEGSFWNILQGKEIQVNDIASLFSMYTDFCHQSEIAAYGREFSKFLNRYAKFNSHSRLDPKYLFTHPNECGIAPIVICIGFNICYKYIDKFSDQDIEDILSGLDCVKYLKKICGKSFGTGYSRDRLVKIVDWFNDEGRKNVYKRYDRIIEDVMMKYKNFKCPMTVGIISAFEVA